MRPTTLAITFAVLAGFGLAPAPAMAAPARISPPCSAGTPLPGDFDGDTHPDQLVGVSGLGDSHPAARYQVTPGDGGAATWLYAGGGLRSVDLNGDVCADAVVQTYAGASLLLGTPDGLDAAFSTPLSLPQSAGLDPAGTRKIYVADAVAIRHDGTSQVVVAGYADDEGPRDNPFLDVFTLDAVSAPGTPQVITLSDVSATEAVALAASGATVAVGLADLTVSGKANAGGVAMFTVDPTDHTTLVRGTTITQDSPGVPGKAEKGDGFGWSLDLRDGRLAVGIPLENNGKVVDAGAVQPILWNEATATFTAARQITQGTRGVVGTDERKDWFGYQVLVTRGLTAAGSYDIAIGACEKVGRASNAGSVTVANFSKAAYRTLTQNSRGITGTAEKGDFFGGALGVLRTAATVDTLLIGAPYERNSVREIGYAIRSDGSRLTSTTRWTSLPVPAASAGITYENWGSSFGR